MTKEVVATDFLPPASQELNTDLEYARNNMYQIIEAGQTGLQGILAVADQSQHPRAYEVLSGYLKNMAELQKNLVEISTAKRDVRIDPEKENSKNVTNNLFVGSTAELSQMLKQARKNDDT
jgi:hypothetical protein